LSVAGGSGGPCWHCNASDIGRRRCFHFNINFTPKQQTGPRTQKSYCQRRDRGSDRDRGSNHGARSWARQYPSCISPRPSCPPALSVEAIYVSAYPTAWQLQAMCGSRSSQSLSCSFLRPTPKCPCWQQHSNNRNTNNAASTYQVIKQPKASHC